MRRAPMSRMAAAIQEKTIKSLITCFVFISLYLLLSLQKRILSCLFCKFVYGFFGVVFRYLRELLLILACDTVR